MLTARYCVALNARDDGVPPRVDFLQGPVVESNSTCTSTLTASSLMTVRVHVAPSTPPCVSHLRKLFYSRTLHHLRHPHFNATLPTTSDCVCRSPLLAIDPSVDLESPPKISIARTPRLPRPRKARTFASHRSRDFCCIFFDSDSRTPRMTTLTCDSGCFNVADTAVPACSNHSTDFVRCRPPMQTRGWLSRPSTTQTEKEKEG